MHVGDTVKCNGCGAAVAGPRDDPKPLAAASRIAIALGWEMSAFRVWPQFDLCPTCIVHRAQLQEATG